MIKRMNSVIALGLIVDGYSCSEQLFPKYWIKLHIVGYYTSKNKGLVYKKC